jgi:hypothetical protein
MKDRKRWLHISYWTGAVIDGLNVLQLLVPSVFAAINRLPDFLAVGALVPIWILQGALCALFAFSYLQARSDVRFSQIRPVHMRKYR